MPKKTLAEHNAAMAAMRKQIAETEAARTSNEARNSDVFDQVMGAPALAVDVRSGQQFVPKGGNPNLVDLTPYFDKRIGSNRDRLKQYSESAREAELARVQTQPQPTSEDQQDALRAQRQARVDALRAEADKVEADIYDSFDAPQDSFDEPEETVTDEVEVPEFEVPEAHLGSEIDPSVAAAYEALQ
jgi:hypothetical protein